MANERDKEEFSDRSERETGSQDGSRNEFGQQGQQPGGSGSEQSGQSGNPTGQPAGGSDTLTGGNDRKESDDPDGSGFVGSKGENSGEYLQEGEKQNFAEQGRGATDDEDRDSGSTS